MRNLSLTGVPMRALNRSFRASARRTPTWLHSAAALTSLIALGGCSAPAGTLPAADDGVDVPEYRGPQPSGALPPQAGNGTTPGATGSNINGSAGTNSPPASNVNEQTGANDTPLTPNTNNNSGNNNSGNPDTSNQGAAGASMVPPPADNQGAGGASMVPPPADNQGAGGASMGGNDNPGDDGNTDPSTPPVEPPPVEPPPVEPPPEPSEPDIPCPADATFCSGFEGAALPNGTNFVIGGDSSFPSQFAIDTTQAHSGSQSFAIPGPSPGFSYRVLTIPAPGQDFWARLYVRVGSEFGDGNHDALFGASNANLTADHNNETVIELSEQFGYMLLNTDDCALACNTPDPQLTLPPNQWHCLEAHYDGNTGHVEIFLEGSPFIDATNPTHQFTFQTFRLGYMRFNTERSVWYDDVILSRSRVGCD